MLQYVQGGKISFCLGKINYYDTKKVEESVIHHNIK